MEVIASASDDFLVDPLNFEVPKTATYIQNRRSVSFFPQTGNKYHATTGATLISFYLTGQEWLDPSTFRIMFDLVNEEAAGQVPDKLLYPIGGPWAFFNRLKISSGSETIEDISDYARCHELFQILSSSDSRANDFAEGFCNYWDDRSTRSHDVNRTHLVGIPGGKSMTVAFFPLLGLLRQKNFIPLKYVPLKIELSLIGSTSEPIITMVTADDEPDPFPITDFNFYKETLSVNWSIQNPQIKCDLITLDGGYENTYDRKIANGTPIQINYNTLYSQIQTVTGLNEMSVIVSRSASRLKSVFVSFIKNTGGPGRSAHNAMKSWNDFFSPAYPDNSSTTSKLNKFNPDGEFEFYMQIGSKLYPEHRMRSHSESMSQLKKCVGHAYSPFYSVDISGMEYRTSKFIIGVDTEKMSGVPWTGLNTRGGDLATIFFKLVGSNPATERKPDRMQVVLNVDLIMQVHEFGITVLN